MTLTRASSRMMLRAERPWREHERAYRDLFADPAVAAALWPGALGGVRSRAQALAILQHDLDHWQARTFGPWVFFEAATGVFVGRGGLSIARIAGQERVEILYAVRSDAWGRGYGSEMAGLSVACARRLGLTDVLGLAALSNGASRRVLEKAGLRVEEIVEHAGLPHWLCRLPPID